MERKKPHRNGHKINGVTSESRRDADWLDVCCRYRLYDPNRYFYQYPIKNTITTVYGYNCACRVISLKTVVKFIVYNITINLKAIPTF